MQYLSYLVSGETPIVSGETPVPTTIRIYGYDVLENLFGQPTEYIVGAVGAASFLLLKGGLKIIGGIAGVGAAAAIYAARNNMLPGNSGGGIQSNVTYAYNYPQESDLYYPPSMNF